MISSDVVATSPSGGGSGSIPILRGCVHLSSRVFVRPGTTECFLTGVSLRVGRRVRSLERRFRNKGKISGGCSSTLGRVGELTGVNSRCRREGRFTGLMDNIFAGGISLRISRHVRRVISCLGAVLINISGSSSNSTRLSGTSVPLLSGCYVLLVGVGILGEVCGCVRGLSRNLGRFCFGVTDSVSGVPRGVSTVRGCCSGTGKVTHVCIYSSGGYLREFSSRYGGAVNACSLPGRFAEDVFGGTGD